MNDKQTDLLVESLDRIRACLEDIVVNQQRLIELVELELVEPITRPKYHHIEESDEA